MLISLIFHLFRSESGRREAGESPAELVWECTHICQSVSGAAPEGRLRLSTHTLAVAVLAVVLPWLQLEKTQHKETKG